MTTAPNPGAGAAAPSLEALLAADRERRSLQGAIPANELVESALKLIGALVTSETCRDLQVVHALTPDSEPSKAAVTQVLQALPLAIRILDQRRQALAAEAAASAASEGDPVANGDVRGE